MSNDQNDQSQPIRLCGLWLNESRAGRKFLSGNLGFAKVLIFAAKERRGEKFPTHYLCLAPLPPKDANGAVRSTTPQSTSAHGAAPSATERLEITDDDIPF